MADTKLKTPEIKLRLIPIITLGMGKLTREAIIQLQITHIKEAKVKVSEFILFIVCVAQMAQLSKSINVASKQQILNNVKIFHFKI